MIEYRNRLFRFIVSGRSVCLSFLSFSLVQSLLYVSIRPSTHVSLLEVTYPLWIGHQSQLMDHSLRFVKWKSKIPQVHRLGGICRVWHTFRSEVRAAISHSQPVWSVSFWKTSYELTWPLLSLSGCCGQWHINLWLAFEGFLLYCNIIIIAAPSRICHVIGVVIVNHRLRKQYTRYASVLNVVG